MQQSSDTSCPAKVRVTKTRYFGVFDKFTTVAQSQYFLTAECNLPAGIRVAVEDCQVPLLTCEQLWPAGVYPIDCVQLRNSVVWIGHRKHDGSVVMSPSEVPVDVTEHV